MVKLSNLHKQQQLTTERGALQARLHSIQYEKKLQRVQNELHFSRHDSLSNWNHLVYSIVSTSRATKALNKAFE